MSYQIKPILGRLVTSHGLTRSESADAMDYLISGAATDAETAAFLTALRMKGETVDEVTGAVEAMRRRVVPIAVPDGVVLDTCGTGGDGAGTFNISTAVAFVCAGAGVVTAKHGNRAVSSRVGSADVLEALGVAIDITPEVVEACVREVGIGFMYAPTHHAALRHAAPARRQLGFRTMLNLLGPMANPAQASHQLVGIFDRGRLETMARVLHNLGVARALVVAGEDGLDEVTLCGRTHAWFNDRGSFRELTITPEAVGIERAPVETLAGGTAAENAQTIRDIFSGEVGPRADIVRLNAGAALWVAEVASDLASGVALATETLREGRALAKLDALIERTQRG